MSNDSTSAGYLTSTGTKPDYDRKLENQIVLWISGVAGIDISLVYPRWTDPQTQIPKNGTTWCAFSVATIPGCPTPANVQVSEERSEQWSWEKVTVTCCFYGPNGCDTAATFRAGLYVDQNNVELNRAGLSLNDVGTIYNLPELINNQWVRRYDLAVTLSRKTTRTYNIKSTVGGNVTVLPETDHGD